MDREALRQQILAVERAREIIQSLGMKKLRMRDAEVRHLAQQLGDAAAFMGDIRIAEGLPLW